MSQYNIIDKPKTTPTAESEFYKETLVLFDGVIAELLTRLDIIRKYRASIGDRDPVEYCKARVKTPSSAKEKLVRKGYEPSYENAMKYLTDVAGVRVVCTFIDDVYSVVELLRQQKDIRIIIEKDYIKNPKPNGYRSYHMIVEVPIHLPGGLVYVPAEIQLRTLAMDCWASLEHRIKYKKDVKHREMIVDELKRCADEIASTDITLETIRDIIENKQV